MFDWLDDIIDWGGNAITEAVPGLITGGVGLLAKKNEIDAAKDAEKTLEEQIAEARALGDLKIEQQLKMKELGLLGGGGGGSRQQANPAAWRDSQAQTVQAKLAQAQLFKELADQMSGRLNQAILSRRR